MPSRRAAASVALLLAALLGAPEPADATRSGGRTGTFRRGKSPRRGVGKPVPGGARLRGREAAARLADAGAALDGAGASEAQLDELERTLGEPTLGLPAAEWDGMQLELRRYRGWLLRKRVGQRAAALGAQAATAVRGLLDAIASGAIARGDARAALRRGQRLLIKAAARVGDPADGLRLIELVLASGAGPSLADQARAVEAELRGRLPTPTRVDDDGGRNRLRIFPF
jgi:hypothetical protein